LSILMQYSSVLSTIVILPSSIASATQIPIEEQILTDRRFKEEISVPYLRSVTLAALHQARGYSRLRHSLSNSQRER
jgi:hypothetical protein